MTTLNCPWCKKIFERITPTKKFCSEQCRENFNDSIERSCDTCGVSSSIRPFRKGRKKCLECQSKMHNKYVLENKEHIREKTKEYLEKNKERLKEKSKQYFAKNKEYFRAKYSEYYRKHSVHKRNHWKQYMQNKEHWLKNLVSLPMGKSGEK